jgi:hypothetical protein
MTEMLRATGVYVVLAENEADAPTVGVYNKGPLEEGPVEGTGVPDSEEGIVAFGEPGIGMLTMVSLDVPGSQSHPNVLNHFRKEGKRLARATGMRFELVLFGPNGREHIEWLGWK